MPNRAKVCQASETQKDPLYSADGRVLLSFPADRKGSYEVSEGVVEIGERAFENSKLTELKLPVSLIKIGERAFEGSRITTMWSNQDPRENGVAKLPENVRTIGDEAFRFSGLKAIIIPDKIESIGEECFRGSSLNSLASSSDTYREGDIMWPSTLRNISDNCFSECDLDYVSIPVSVIIGTNAFKDTKIKSLSISNDTVLTGFNNSQVGQLLLPKGYALDDSHFQNLSNSKILSISFPDGSDLYEIKEGIVYTKDLKELVWFPSIGAPQYAVISPDIIRFGSHAFENTDFNGVIELPSSIEILPQRLFNKANIRGIVLSENTKGLETEVFYRGSCDFIIFRGPVTVDKICIWGMDINYLCFSPSTKRFNTILFNVYEEIDLDKEQVVFSSGEIEEMIILTSEVLPGVKHIKPILSQSWGIKNLKVPSDLKKGYLLDIYGTVNSPHDTYSAKIEGLTTGLKPLILGSREACGYFKPGETYPFSSMIISYEGGEEQKSEWTTSDESVASFNGNELNIHREGNFDVTLTVYDQNGNTYSDTIEGCIASLNPVFPDKPQSGIQPIETNEYCGATLGVYDLQGRYLGTSIQDLTPGIYIVRNSSGTRKIFLR